LRPTAPWARIHTSTRPRSLPSDVPAPARAATDTQRPTTPGGVRTAGNVTDPGTAQTTSVCGGLTGARHITKAVWIWFENHAFRSITPTAAPYINQIKRECGDASNYHSVTSFHSLSEYLAATGGSNHGVTDDAAPASHQLNYNNIFRQIDQAGKTWRSYQQAMASNCMKTETGRYAPKHNPAAYYVGANGATSCAASDVPLPASPSFASNFTIIEPDLCASMHDCSVATGDAWLKSILPKVIASTGYQAGNTAVFVTFDEGAGGNETLFTLVLSRFTTPGTVSGAALNHYALLHTTENILGLPCLLNACTARDMRSAFGLI
jgi:phosphatidylinositol-3-phosphatase